MTPMPEYGVVQYMVGYIIIQQYTLEKGMNLFGEKVKM